MMRTRSTAAALLWITSTLFAAGEIPRGYQVLRQTNAGLLMMTSKGKAPSLAAATESVLNDLDDFFDDDYDVYDGFEDQKTHAALLSGLKAKYHGKAVRGLVLARKTDAGANLFVAFVNADADRNAWTALMTPAVAPPAAVDPGAPAASDAQAPKAITLREYQFPDNTGSIGLADGYTTNAASCGSMFTITGAGGQELIFGAGFSINTPDSTAVQLARQYPTPAAATMLVAPFGDPAVAFSQVIPQLSRISQSQGQAATTIDHLQKVRDLPPLLTNARRALISYGATRIERRSSKHVQALAEVNVIPTSNQSYLLSVTSVSAPDATFQQDLPVMLTMASSLKENGGQIQRNTQAWIDQRNAWFDAQQAGHREQVKAGDDYIHNSQKNSDETLKSITDFDETIRGHRTVEDTTTGQRTEVNLGDVDQVVDELNRQEPGRYKQIKLRDQ